MLVVDVETERVDDTCFIRNNIMVRVKNMTRDEDEDIAKIKNFRGMNFFHRFSVVPF